MPMATLLMNARALWAGPNRNPSQEVNLSAPLSNDFSSRSKSRTGRTRPTTRYQKARELVTHHAQQTVKLLRNRQRSPSRNQPRQPTLNNRFLSLPVELQLQILSHLTYYELINFRNTSKPFRELTENHESYIVNNYIRTCVPSYITKLYPPPSKSPVRLQYLTDLVHKQKVSTGLATYLAEQVVKGLMGRRRLIPDGHRVEALGELRRGMAPLIFALFHFLETYRERKLEKLDTDRHGGTGDIGSLPATNNLKIQSEILSQYPDGILSQVHQMYHLLLHLFLNRMTPRTLPIIRAFMPRSNSQPPSNASLAQVLVLGGMEEVWQLYKVKGYGKRRKALDRYVKRLDAERSRGATSKAGNDMRTSRKEELQVRNDLASSPSISNLAQLDVDELMDVWIPAAEQRLLARKVIQSLDEVSCCGRFVYQLLWPDGEDDDDDDDMDEMDSDDEDEAGDFHILDGGTLTGDDSSWDGDILEYDSEYADSADSAYS